MKLVKILPCLPALICLQVGHGHAQPVPFSTSNLPVISIETGGIPILDEPKSPAYIRVFDMPEGGNGIDGQTPAHEGWIGIETRGNSSLYQPKKQYGFETRNPDGADTDVSLLGMPSEEDWVLSSPYADKTLIRNALGMHLARVMGRYASRTAFCELVIDGSYRGVYVLMERIKRGPHRVDIAKLNPDENEGEAVSGGYIFKMDPGKGKPFEGWAASFDSTGYFSYLYHYPEPKDITPEQRAYIVTFFRQFEDATSAPDFADPDNGWRRIADARSFVDYLLLQELANNVDGFSYSVYFHKDRDRRDGRLKMGPAWDFYSAFGNCHYAWGSASTGWRIHAERRPFWWHRMLEDKGFVLDAQSRWKNLRKEGWSKESIFAFIASLTVLLDEAKDRHFLKWNLLGQWRWPNAYVGKTYADEISFLKLWLRDRLEWIDRHIDSLSARVIRPVQQAHHEILSIFPHPSRLTANVEYVLDEYADADLLLIDALGRTVSVIRSGLHAAGRHRAEADLSGLPSGVYVLRLMVADASMDSRAITVMK